MSLPFEKLMELSRKIARNGATINEEPEDTSHEEGVVCPYCGHLHKDSWEWTRDDECGETECDSCEREFEWSAYTSVTYYGKPIAKEGE